MGFNEVWTAFITDTVPTLHYAYTERVRNDCSTLLTRSKLSLLWKVNKDGLVTFHGTVRVTLKNVMITTDYKNDGEHQQRRCLVQEIPINIFVPYRYPAVPPTVVITGDAVNAVQTGHPYVDSSGKVFCYALTQWDPDDSNLYSLAKDVVHILKTHPPLTYATYDRTVENKGCAAVVVPEALKKKLREYMRDTKLCMENHCQPPLFDIRKQLKPAESRDPRILSRLYPVLEKEYKLGCFDGTERLSTYLWLVGEIAKLEFHALKN